MTTTSTYRKKPVVIEAMRWTGGARAATSVINWILAGDGIASYDDPDGNGGGLLRINTLEGTMRANPGDWIILKSGGTRLSDIGIHDHPKRDGHEVPNNRACRGAGRLLRKCTKRSTRRRGVRDR